MAEHDETAPTRDDPVEGASARPELVQLRLRAEQLARTKDDTGLLALVDGLRADSEWWAHLWGPAIAIAARRSGRDDSLGFLVSAIDGGFSQPELFEGELEELFGGTAEWPALVARMSANVPPPGLTLLEWPDPGIQLPLQLYRIAPERLGELIARLPDRRTTAWETATAMLEWVRRRWEHANDHVDDPDAVQVLTRVEAGERFACVEYSIVLSQALNAVEIPARRVDLRQANHHVGIGRGHVVSEAWIDDLDQWVLLDGQNGAFWVDADDEPMGVRDLQAAYDAGERPRMVALVHKLQDLEQAMWFTYFASASTTGCTWASAGFSPVFEGIRMVKTDLVVHDGDLAYPQLSAVTLGLTGSVEEPAVRFDSRHPHANGFLVADGTSSWTLAQDEDQWKLAMTPGRHDVEISTRTPYGFTSPRVLSYLVR